MRVLLTGYEPFGGEPVNPSALLVADLEQRPPEQAGLELSAAVLPVDSRRFRAALGQAMASARPELVVAVGQATGRPDVGLEALAHNVLDYRGDRDNGGHAAGGEPLADDGPPRLHVGLPLASLARRLASRGLPVRASLDAGRHLCNALLYELLLRHAGIPSLLVHVPLVPEQAARRARDEPSRPYALSRECLAALLALLAEERAARRSARA